MGRINRSSKKWNSVLFDYDNAKIYIKRCTNKRPSNFKIRRHEKILNEKRFDDYYKEVLKLILSDNESSAIERILIIFHTD